MRSSNTRYLVGLDHMRGFGAMLIVFYHALHLLSFGVRAGPGGDPTQFWVFSKNPAIALIEEGHTSVAMFMVLSGFVFSVAAYGRDIDYFAYLKNRFLRVYPLYVVLLITGLAAFPTAYSTAAMVQALFFQANYVGSLNIPPFSSMFWAVSVEFQFYLLFPFLHRFIERDGVRWVVGCIGLFLALRWLAGSASANPRDVTYWHMLGRLDQFLIGMVSARVFVRCENLRLPWGLITLAATTLMLAVLVGFNQMGGFPAQAYWKLIWPTIEATGWALVLISYTVFAKKMPGFLSKPLAGLGTISYSIYLLHFTCLIVIPRWIPLPITTSPNPMSQWYALKFVVPVLLPLATLSYYALERPFLNMRVRYLREPVPPASLVPAPVQPAANDRTTDLAG